MLSFTHLLNGNSIQKIKTPRILKEPPSIWKHFSGVDLEKLHDSNLVNFRRDQHLTQPCIALCITDHPTSILPNN